MADTPTARAEKRRQTDYSVTITVLVGPTEESFTAHEGIITHLSAFFRAACSGNFRESKERVVRLPEADPEIFQILLNWMYTKDVVALQEDEMSEEEVRLGSNRFLLFAKLYVLADQLEIRMLRNIAIDSIIQIADQIRKYPPHKAITVAYLETLGSSTLRKLFRDYFTSGVTAGWLSSVRDQLPADFIFDMALTVEGSFEKPSAPKFSLRCAYHEHIDGEPKCV